MQLRIVVPHPYVKMNCVSIILRVRLPQPVLTIVVVHGGRGHPNRTQPWGQQFAPLSTRGSDQPFLEQGIPEVG